MLVGRAINFLRLNVLNKMWSDFKTAGLRSQLLLQPFLLATHCAPLPCRTLCPIMRSSFLPKLRLLREGQKLLIQRPSKFKVRFSPSLANKANFVGVYSCLIQNLMQQRNPCPVCNLLCIIGLTKLICQINRIHVIIVIINKARNLKLYSC